MSAREELEALSKMLRDQKRVADEVTTLAEQRKKDETTTLAALQLEREGLWRGLHDLLYSSPSLVYVITRELMDFLNQGRSNSRNVWRITPAEGRIPYQQTRSLSNDPDYPNPYQATVFYNFKGVIMYRQAEATKERAKHRLEQIFVGTKFTTDDRLDRDFVPHVGKLAFVHGFSTNPSPTVDVPFLDSYERPALIDNDFLTLGIFTRRYYLADIPEENDALADMLNNPNTPKALTDTVGVQLARFAARTISDFPGK